jgi:PAS domain S-box-containing protein
LSVERRLPRVAPSRLDAPLFDQTLLEAIPAAVYVCAADGTLVQYNRRAVELWGRAPDLAGSVERFCGSYRLFLPDGTYLPHDECPMVETLRSGVAVENGEIVVERPDGSRITCLVNISALRNAEGSIVGAINSFQDISARKAADEELVQRRVELEDFFENAAVALHIVGDDGTILRANQAELDLLGYECKEYVGRNITEFHADGPALDDILARLCSGRNIERYPARLKAKDGSIRHVEITSSGRFRDGKFVNTRCFTVDVTERRQAETALREREKRYRDLLQALPIAIYTTDAAGRVTFYNRAAAEFAGREPEIGAEWCVTWRLFQPDGTPLPHDECPMAISLKERRPARGVEAIAERPDGTKVPFIPYPTPLYDASGALIGGVNMLVDISDRKRSEIELQQLNESLEQRVTERTQELAAALAKLSDSERQFRLLVQGVVDYAIYMLDESGTVTSWNSGAQRIKGYSAEEVIGRHFSHFYTEEDREAGLPERALAAAKRLGKIENEGWRVRKDGQRIWASALIVALHDETGRLIGFAKVVRDLTEKRATEEQLRQAQKMEAIGQLTGGVAHDFNNLLTAIIGNLDALTTLLPEQKRAQRFVDSALHAAWRGARLTEDLLAFSRRRTPSREVVDVNRQLRGIATLCQRAVGDSVPVALDLADDLWTCRIDAAQFESAVLNLAANARDAMQGVGALTIATRTETLPADGSIDAAPGDYVVVTVRDTGCGMSEQVLQHAFEPFYTTKEVGKGTGLGLSQVYGFVKQHGGTVRIESSVGRGTSVRLYLPRADGAVAQEGSEDAAAASSKGTATILVVEDDADVREMLLSLVSGLGYQTRVAATGPEALAVLRADPAIELLFTDLIMPAGMSGLELARAARGLNPDLRILVSSGYAGRGATQDPSGMEFPFIAKPYPPSALALKIREVLATEPVSMSVTEIPDERLPLKTA